MHRRGQSSLSPFNHWLVTQSTDFPTPSNFGILWRLLNPELGDYGPRSVPGSE